MKRDIAYCGRLVSAEQLEVRRLMASLEPDASFGTAGVANSPFRGIAVAELADQKIVVVGNTSDTTANLSLARFNPDGTPDSSFGSAGVLTKFPIDELYAAKVSADGTVLASGKDSGGGFVVRYLPDGNPDTTFDADGILRMDDLLEGDPKPRDLAFTADGKIYVGGPKTSQNWIPDSYIIRLNTDGSLDTSFANQGMLIDATGGVSLMLVQPDGKLLVADGTHGLIRYKASGTGRDKSFSGNGYYPIGAAQAMTLQADGDILLSDAYGGSFSSTDLERISADGVTKEYFASPYASAIAVDDQSGMITVLAGTALIRYDGVAPPAGSSATGETISLGPNNYGSAMVATSDGGFLVAGTKGGGAGFLQRFRATQASSVSLDSGLLTIRGSTSADTIGLTVRDAQLRVRRNGALQTFALADVSRIEIPAAAGDDVIDFSGISIPTYVDAGAGNDRVTAGAANDSITGGAGRDTLYGGEGNDRVNGNGTIDKLFGEGGNDRIYGGAHNDYIDGGGGVDRIWGEAGNDTLCGASSNDKIDGGLDDDSILGGKGSDLLTCGGGADSLFGNDGDDTFNAVDGAKDLLDGGVGSDASDTDDELDECVAIELP